MPAESHGIQHIFIRTRRKNEERSGKRSNDRKREILGSIICRRHSYDSKKCDRNEKYDKKIWKFLEKRKLDLCGKIKNSSF